MAELEFSMSNYYRNRLRLNPDRIVPYMQHPRFVIVRSLRIVEKKKTQKESREENKVKSAHGLINLTIF